MQEYYSLLVCQPLFEGLSIEQINTVISTLGVKVDCFASGKEILVAGGKADKIGIILSGSALVVQDDAQGNRNIITGISAGDMFGEVFAAAKVQVLPVSVIAKEDCRLLFIRLENLLRIGGDMWRVLSANLINVLASKSFLLSKKNEILSKRDTAQKIMEFMRQQAGAGKRFTIDFNRQQLADYLCVERSAMTTVLFSLKKQRRIDFDKNEFVWYLPNSK